MPRDYARFYPRYFTGETGKLLRGDPVAIAVGSYLIAGPASNMIGLYELALPLLAHHLGIPLEGASKALRRVSEVGFAHYDEATETVWLPEGARHQIGESLKEGDNQVPWVRSLLLQMRKSPFYNDFLDRYGEAYHLQDMPRSEGPSKALRRGSEAPPKPVTDPVQEQEQEQGTDPERTTTQPATRRRVASKKSEHPSTRKPMIDRITELHASPHPGNGNGIPAWKAWGPKEYISLNQAADRIGDDETIRYFGNFLLYQEPFYAGHAPTKFLANLATFSEPPKLRGFTRPTDGIDQGHARQDDSPSSGKPRYGKPDRVVHLD